MSYNKKEIFTHAWKLVKGYAYSMSKALKSAWKAAKEGTKTIALDVVKETEKAVAFEVILESDGFRKGFAVKTAWCPKSLLKDGAAPLWFISKKVKELCSYYSHIDLASVGEFVF